MRKALTFLAVAALGGTTASAASINISIEADTVYVDGGPCVPDTVAIPSPPDTLWVPVPCPPETVFVWALPDTVIVQAPPDTIAVLPDSLLADFVAVMDAEGTYTLDPSQVALVVAGDDTLTITIRDVATTVPDTVWAETRLGAIEREARDFADRGMTVPWLDGTATWGYEQWRQYLLDRWAANIPFSWPAYYWNPPDGGLRYPVQVYYADGTIEYLPVNAGDSSVVVSPGEAVVPRPATRAGEAWTVRKE